MTMVLYNFSRQAIFASHFERYANLFDESVASPPAAGRRPEAEVRTAEVATGPD